MLTDRSERQGSGNLFYATVEPAVLATQALDHLRAGRLGVAESLLVAARAANPTSVDLIIMASRLAAARESPDQALPGLDLAIESTPTDSGLRKCRAELRLQTGNIVGAAQDAADAVVRDEDDAEAKAILGLTLLELDRFSEAIACLAEAVDAATTEPAYRERLALALERIGATKAALEIVRNALTLHPGHIPLRNVAIRLCGRLHDYEAALFLAEQGRSLGAADAATFAMKGHILSHLGRSDAAILAYQDALRLGSDEPKVLAACGIRSGRSNAHSHVV